MTSSLLLLALLSGGADPFGPIVVEPEKTETVEAMPADDGAVPSEAASEPCVAGRSLWGDRFARYGKTHYSGAVYRCYNGCGGICCDRRSRARRRVIRNLGIGGYPISGW